MGVDYSAYAVIGLKIRSGDLSVETTSPGCKCLCAVQGANFCPKCGAKAVVKSSEPRPEYDESTDTLCGFPIIFGTLNESERGGTPVIVALRSVRADDGDEGGCALSDGGAAPSTGELNRLRDSLSKLGLWDESAFGLWAVCCCSY